MARSPADLQTFIDMVGLQAELIHLPVPTPTVQAAAAAVEVSPNRIVKSILFKISDSPVLVVACGPTPVDRRLLARHFGVGRKQVKLVQGQDVLAISGYPVGAVPPFGHLQAIKTLIDFEVLQHEQVFAGGGAQDVLMRVAPAEIKRITGAEVVSLISREADE
jgi:prolyl-tRNA editing enzyme YbaK/EbsC (Cys-tRNA(Pro) deacylase)